MVPRTPEPGPRRKGIIVATTRSAHTVWEGNLLEGNGVVTFDSSGIGEQPVSWPSRAEQANGKTSPEELIAAAHSSCFSMALSHGLAGAGTPPTKLTTSADVTFQPGEGITGIHLTVEGTVPGLDGDAFAAAAEDAKKNCPVSQALSGTTITLTAKLA
ncbi:osmotically inducible protein OsmC [Streptomyces sp. V3I8]|nr:osmotically inducible protein OsmC [Streptomyces sp. V3I8]